MMATELWAVLLVLFQTIPGAVGPILVKKGTAHLKFNLRSLIRNYILILGFSLYGFSAILFTIALRGGELSILYPPNHRIFRIDFYERVRMSASDRWQLSEFAVHVLDIPVAHQDKGIIPEDILFVRSRFPIGRQGIVAQFFQAIGV